MNQAPFSIAAFWHNDADKGIGVMFQHGDLAAIEHQIAEACAEMDQPDHEHSGIMLARLAEYASRKDTLTIDEQIDVACLVGALQHHRVIISDNYNGLMIMREVKSDDHIPDGQHRTMH